MAERNRDFVRDTERRLRRAERGYGPLRMVRLERISPQMIAGLIEQKRAQYQRTLTGDVFAGAANVRLIAALNESPAPECRLILNRLEAGDHVLALHLGPQHHDVLSYWFPVYDPQARDISPGRLLLWHTIKRAAEDGISLIDRGAGDAPHKRELATGMTRYGSANWSATGVRSLVARAYQGLEWRLEARRQSLLRKQAERQIL
jgi:CelD/BcsL family acetyltransferase involved in cellulose biosynthesis